MNEQESKAKINLEILGQSYRKTLVVSREPLRLMLLNSINALIEPELLPILVKWLKSVSLEQAANELGTSVAWCHKFRQELIERELECKTFITN